MHELAFQVVWLEVTFTYRKLDVAGCSSGNASYYNLILDTGQKIWPSCFPTKIRKYPDIFFVKEATASYFAFLYVIYMTGFCFTEH